MEDAFLRWPSREALGREGIPRPRRLLAWAVRLLVAGVLLWSTLHDNRVRGWTAAAGIGGFLMAGLLAWAFFRLTLGHRLWPSLSLLLLLLGPSLGTRSGLTRRPGAMPSGYSPRKGQLVSRRRSRPRSPSAPVLPGRYTMWWPTAFLRNSCTWRRPG